MLDLLLVQKKYPHDEHLPPLLYPGLRQHPFGKWLKRTDGEAAIIPIVDRCRKSLFSDSLAGLLEQRLFIQIGILLPPIRRSVFSIHAPCRAESYSKQVNKLLNEIGRIALSRQIILGGDFNLTISRPVDPDRPVSMQDLAIQSRLADEFGMMNGWQTANHNRACRVTDSDRASAARSESLKQGAPPP
jgi:endonuclease/exonuclease/phosphatase family metal-dependent hydrolase